MEVRRQNGGAKETKLMNVFPCQVEKSLESLLGSPLERIRSGDMQPTGTVSLVKLCEHK